MPVPLSAYVLTKNSERQIRSVLEAVSQVADDIVVLDSGSTDQTEQICASFANCRVILRPFDNFVAQRNYAAKCCRYDWVLFVDSDELLDDEAIAGILDLKQNGFTHDAYSIDRYWHVLGKAVHCILPVSSPDQPIRLFDRRSVSFSSASNLVHETIDGYSSVSKLTGSIKHITFSSRAELTHKLDHYTDLAALDIIRRKKSSHIAQRWLSPCWAFLRWYFIKGGYRDGWVGLQLGVYAWRYHYLK